jgi:catechol 2,3-dioxygenase-like lactoylglutathione lyase family enzyme
LGGFRGGRQHRLLFTKGEKRTTPGVHVAFRGDDRAMVRAFHEAAIKAGGKDNGPPGIRKHHHPNYYGAFVYDLDGHNIEAVCHKPESPAG